MTLRTDEKVKKLDENANFLVSWFSTMISFDLHPFTLLISIFIVLVLKQAINAIGKKNIENFVWKTYCQVAPKFGHTKLATIAEKSNESAGVNRQRKAISAQDQYAKWTKLNRQFDKLNAEIETLNKELGQERATVVKVIGQVITIATAVPIWFSRVWFRKSILFHLPPGVFPYPLERVFGLPFVVLGGVGLTVWMFSVNSVISNVLFLVKFPFEKPVAKPVKQEKVTEVTGSSDKSEI